MTKVTVHSLCLAWLLATGAGCVSDPTPHPAADVGNGFPGGHVDGRDDEAAVDTEVRCGDADAASDASDGCGEGEASDAAVSDDGDTGPTETDADASE